MKPICTDQAKSNRRSLSRADAEFHSVIFIRDLINRHVDCETSDRCRSLRLKGRL